jgi:tRNA A37 methylthiotransferase MiaB
MVKFLFVHSWNGFSLAEWIFRETFDSQSKIPVSFHSLDLLPYDHDGFNRFAQFVSLWQPDIIGFSCHYWSLPHFIDASICAKQISPQVKIVLGGPNVNAQKSATKILTQNQTIDYVVRGPGEIPLLLFVESINSSHRLEHIPGLSFKKKDSIQHNLDVPAYPDGRNPIFHMENLKLVERLDNIFVISYQTVRGCKNSCSYCQYPSRSYVEIDMDMVKKELEFICLFKIPHLRICDAHFGGSRKRAIELLELLARKNKNGISVKIHPNLKHVDEEYLRLANDANCELTSVGIQSTQEHVLKINKRPDIGKNRKQIALILKHFPRTPADIIIGLPGDDKNGLKKTFNDVLDMGFSEVNLFRLMLFPGTPVMENRSQLLGENVVTAQTGQILHSAFFAQDSYLPIAQLEAGMRVAVALKKTMSFLSGTNPDKTILDKICSLGENTLLDIESWVCHSGPAVLLKRLDAILDQCKLIIRDRAEVRDALLYDFLHYQYERSATRNIRRFNWLEGSKIREKSKVLLFLEEDKLVFWDLEAKAFFLSEELMTISGPELVVLNAESLLPLS